MQVAIHKNGEIVKDGVVTTPESRRKLYEKLFNIKLDKKESDLK